MTALETLLFWVRINNHPVYEKYVIDAYEEEHGAHFDEAHARKAVEKMHHHDSRGEYHSGEHWTIEQVESAMHRFDLDDCDTKWDVYVAVHMWWHDLGSSYERRGRSEEELIDDAIVWSFMDEDAPDGKIWKYIHAMG